MYCCWDAITASKATSLLYFMMIKVMKTNRPKFYAIFRIQNSKYQLNVVGRYKIQYKFIILIHLWKFCILNFWWARCSWNSNEILIHLRKFCILNFWWARCSWNVNEILIYLRKFCILKDAAEILMNFRRTLMNLRKFYILFHYKIKNERS